jgi:hypothetical protein
MQPSKKVLMLMMGFGRFLETGLADSLSPHLSFGFGKYLN